ncbi:unnamed protein product, partial [Symbiodinium sp. CCMP2592]
IYSRPLKADKFLDDTMEKLVMGKTAVVKAAAYSLPFKNLLEGFIKTMEDRSTNAVRNFSLAKQRFESSYEPMLRLTLFLEAFIMAAQQIIRNNSSEETAVCNSFLQLLTEERLLTLAMLGDASACILRLTRFLDSEEHDISGVADQCLECANSLHHLFADQACDDNGLTRHMLARLERPLVWLFKDGTAGSVGGNPAKTRDALAKCRPRFLAYTKLALQTLMAEFPSFGCLMAFRAFQLGVGGCNSRKRKNPTGPGAQTRQECVERLALLCDLPKDTLLEQLEARSKSDHRPAAQAVYNSTDVDTFDAWKRAWLSYENASGGRKRHPGDVLGEALQRFGAYNGCTSSGVEQSFGKQTQLFGKQRLRMLESTANDENALCLDALVDDAKLCHRARVIWTHLQYGKPRKMKSDSRITKGMTRKKTKKDLSIKAWRDASQKKVLKEVRSKGPLKSVKQLHGKIRFARGSSAWTSGHETEAAFQERKLDKKFLDAALDKKLLQDEQTKVAGTALQVHAKAREAKRREQEKEARKRQDLDMRRPRILSLGAAVRGKVVAVEKELSLPANALVGCQEVEQQCKQAQVCIVENVASPSSRMRWVLALFGGLCLSKKFAASAGKHGPFLKYEAASAKKRAIWISESFQASIPGITDLITAACRKPGSQWTLLQRESEVTTTRGSVIVLIEAADTARKRLYRGQKKAVTAKEFLKMISVVDKVASRLC